MKTLRIFLSISFLTLLMVACQQEQVIEEITEDAISQNEPEFFNKRAQKRPFSARFISIAEGAAPNAAVCGAGFPVLALTQSGNGNATHMGNISLVLNSCVDIGPTQATPPGPPVVLGAFIVITAANGDELHLSGSGNQGSPFNINGGTGRFLNATGVVNGTFTPIGFNPAGMPNKFASTLNGYIIY